MKVIIYKCDICGKVLSDESAEPKIRVPHINAFHRGFRFAYNKDENSSSNWIMRPLFFGNKKDNEHQYCIPCLVKKLQDLN